MRAHVDIFNVDYREPWLQSPRVQAVIRDSIHQRYALSHYLYTEFKKSTLDGLPIIRPLWYEFPQDTMTFNISDQFMWGDSFLIAPKYQAPDLE